MASMASSNVLPFLTPAFVSLVQPLYQGMLRYQSITIFNQRTSHLLGRRLKHVVTVPARNRNKRHTLGVVTDLLDEVRRFLDDFIETILRPL